MLNLEEIAQRIADPTVCRPEDMNDLREFAIKYPYAQIFPILYLKGLAMHNHVSFEDELTNYSYQIADRKQLFQLIHQHQSGGGFAQNLPRIEPVSLEDIEIVKQSEPLESKIITITNESDDSAIKGEELLSEKFEISEEDLEDVAIPLNIKGSEKLDDKNQLDTIHIENLKIQQDEEIDDFSKEIIMNTIAASYSLSELKPRESDKSSSDIEKQEERPHFILPSQTENRSFSEWLKSNVNIVAGHSSDDKKSSDTFVTNLTENDPEFAERDNRIEVEKTKKEFFSPVKKAKESLDSNQMPVSETLAKIFVLQGNYPKAIFVFEQLILKFPEKKPFFVSQIEELNKKINTV